MRWLIFGFALLGAISFSWAQPTQVPEALKPYIGKPVPDAALIDADGKKLKISDFRGKVLLLNFWSPY
ncbi:MAG: redoxin domain-containing protein [Armatimonadetes bacterium]|nr:redoxin domain-containing protein [Armatimonadota bacterium]MCX7969293.1 redoxin domain-containing protein [Armatimonadota bacterium]